jgi:hypothetical protein
LKLYLFAFQIPHGLSDGLLSTDIGQHPRGLVPVLLEDDQDMEEGIQHHMEEVYGNVISEWNGIVLVFMQYLLAQFMYSYFGHYLNPFKSDDELWLRALARPK